jgi:hypothetical protein
METHAHPLFLSPAFPTELLWHIIHNCAFPTTLIVCSSRADFISSLTHQIGNDTRKEMEGAQLLAAPLYLVAVAKHIRLVFLPTVSHLRAFLSVFSVQDSKVSAPPLTTSANGKPQRSPLLLIYGFLDMHRDTSEWSVQGLSNTTAVFVETARRVGFQAVAVEPKSQNAPDVGMDDLLTERLPVLSGSSRRDGPALEGGGWTGRTVDVRRVLERWFHFQPEGWGTEKGVGHNSDALLEN